MPFLLPRSYCHFNDAWNPKVLKVKDNSYIRCFGISCHHIETIKPLLLEELTLKQPPQAKNEELAKRIRATDSVALHIRRGDYLFKNDFFSICYDDYYIKAIDIMNNHYNAPVFLFFQMIKNG
jgi:hypothetical protein